MRTQRELTHELTRRQFLKLGLLSGALVLLGSQTACTRRTSGGQTPGPPQGAPSPSPAGGLFQCHLPLPEVLRPTRADDTADYYEISMKEGQAEILPGHRTTVWGYEGSYPGPTIRTRMGRRVVVRQTNQLPEPMTIHLHGGHVPGEMDGHPTDLIRPGSYKDYAYPNNQLPATLWYHDHVMNQTARHVFMGLAGFYILEDDLERNLPLPRGDYEIPLVIQDRLFNPDGSLNYALTTHSGMGNPRGGPMGGMGGPGGGPMGDMGGMGGMMGMNDQIFLGDTIVVNGVAWPFFQVANRKYRLRILNGSNAREYELVLSSGQPFVQIGTDGGMLPSPITRSSLYLGSAERADVVVDFSSVPVGTQVALQNRLGDGPTAVVMRFDVVRREREEFTVPDSLRPLETLDPSSAVRTRGFTMSSANNNTWLINGQPYNPNRTDVRTKPGDVEIWQFFNRSMMAHSMHIHHTQWLILDRNGAAPPEWERGWKDTFTVQPMERVSLIARFADHTGTYVFHCHILEHEDRGMMAQFGVG